MPIHYRYMDVPYRDVPMQDLCAAVTEFEQAVRDQRRVGGRVGETFDRYERVTKEHWRRFDCVSVSEVFATNAELVIEAEALVERNERALAQHHTITCGVGYLSSQPLCEGDAWNLPRSLREEGIEAFVETLAERFGSRPWWTPLPAIDPTPHSE
jgi:hypothetical protein